MKQTTLSILLLALALAACSVDEQEAAFQEMKASYDEARASLADYRRSFDQVQEAYMALRARYDSNVNNRIGKDSLHTELRRQHDLTLEKHQQFFEHQQEVLAEHDDLLKRLTVKDYPVENRMADFEEMLEGIAILQKEYEYINAEQNQITEEQEGMLRELGAQTLN